MNTFKHLEAATTYSSVTGNQCVQRAAALMLDLDSSASLVFGIMRAATAEERLKDPNASPVRFIHAWVEVGEDLYAPTLLEKMKFQLKPVPRHVYYEVNGITKTWRLPYAEFMKVAKRFSLSAAFRHRKARAGSAEVADALLNAAKVRFRLSERRTLLPIEDDGGRDGES